jgi:hypothetical protein
MDVLHITGYDSFLEKSYGTFEFSELEVRVLLSGEGLPVDLVCQGVKPYWKATVRLGEDLYDAIVYATQKRTGFDKGDLSPQEFETGFTPFVTKKSLTSRDIFVVPRRGSFNDEDGFIARFMPQYPPFRAEV